MDLRQLQYFLRVAQLGSFTRASASLSVVQPALSRQIRLLEAELGQVLLHRTGRGVTLTEAGRRLVMHGQRILAQVEHARIDLRDLRDAPVGPITIAVAPSIGPLLALDLVHAFQQRFPLARLTLVEGRSAQVNDWITTGEVDLALNYNPIPSAQVEVEPLVEHALHVIGPLHEGPGLSLPAAGVPLRALPRYPLVMPARPHSVRMMLEAVMASAGVQPHVEWEVDLFPTLLQMVRGGMGYAVMADVSARGYTEPGSVRMVPIVEPAIPMVVTLSVSRLRTLSPLVQQARSLLRERVCALLPGRQIDDAH